MPNFRYSQEKPDRSRQLVARPGLEGLDELDHPWRLGGVRAVIQRVLRASVVVDGAAVGAIDEPGLLVYLGVTHDDGPEEIAWMARKVWDLRLLRDERSASDIGAPVLVVSQFTLYGDARKGRRPTWQAAAPGPVSEPAYDAVCAELERLGARVERGVFGADMQVESVNDGPITLILEK
jgi:D-tyrosyl-tRNA(Tyr) deacylase